MSSKDIDHLKVLKEALSKGGDYADLFIEKSALTAVQIDGERVERAQMGIDSGAGLRVLDGERTLYASTTEIAEKSLLKLAGDLADAIGSNGKALSSTLQENTGKPWMKIKIDPAGVSLEDKVKLAQRADETARKMDSRIKQVRVNFADSHREVEIAAAQANGANDGVIARELRNQTLMVAHVVAADGDVVQTGYEPIGGMRGMELFDEDSPEAIAQRAVKRALLMLEAPPVPAGRMAVVISSEAGGTMIHEAVGHGLEADLAGEGLSVYTGRIGEQIASELITVVDDATVPGARGSFAFDDEGVPAQRTVLVDRGKLVAYMHSRQSAMKAGTQSTGNGRRESYHHRPVVRMTNTMILAGRQNPEEIVRSVDKGLFVKKMGGGQVNTVNGDFVFEVTEGYMIEGGKIGQAVRNATLIGNGPDVLLSIDMIASDLGFGIGTCGKDGQGVPVADAQPTLRIPEITVGGKSQ